MDIYASDEEKGEEIKQWWRDNGRFVATLCVFAGLLIFSGRFWFDYKSSQSVNASALYQQVSILLSADKKADAENATTQLFSDYSNTPYAVFAAFNMASQAVKEGNNDAAKVYLTWVNENSSLAAHTELAKLRLAQILLMEQQFDQAIILIEQQQSAAFLSLWAELKGDIYLAQDQPDKARSQYQTALLTLNSGDARQAILQLKFDDVAG